MYLWAKGTYPVLSYQNHVLVVFAEIKKLFKRLSNYTTSLTHKKYYTN